MISDPAKLVPLVLAATAMVGLLMGVVTFEHAFLLLAAAGILHPAISAVNNVNGPK